MPNLQHPATPRNKSQRIVALEEVAGSSPVGHPPHDLEVRRLNVTDRERAVGSGQPRTAVPARRVRSSVTFTGAILFAGSPELIEEIFSRRGFSKFRSKDSQSLLEVQCTIRALPRHAPERPPAGAIRPPPATRRSVGLLLLGRPQASPHTLQRGQLEGAGLALLQGG